MIFAKKSLGQNFLTDRNILEKIVSVTTIKNKIIFEVGPGTGNLTSFILKNKPKKLFVIEKDNDLAKNLNIKYNNLDNFLEEVRQAIINPYPEFASLGLKDSNDEYHQISNGILQIENELYDCIRPKRAGDSGKRPYQLLKDEGIKYVEVRGIDLSPDEVTGISKNQMRIIDLILMHCLINSSPEMNNKEKAIIESNDAQTIKNGRNLNTKIIYK